MTLPVKPVADMKEAARDAADTTGLGTVIVEVGTASYGSTNIKSFYLREGIWFKLPLLKIKISDQGNSFMQRTVVNDAEEIRVTWGYDTNDKAIKVMRFMLLKHSIEQADLNNAHTVVTLVAIPYVPQAFANRTKSFSMKPSSEVAEEIAGLAGAAGSSINAKSSDAMTWLMLNQSVLQFMEHLEKRAMYSDEEDAPFAYFDRNANLCYNSMLTAAGKPAKWTMRYSNSAERDENAKNEEIIINQIQYLNYSGLFNTAVGYGVTVNSYDYDGDNKNEFHAKGAIGATTNANRNKNNIFMNVDNWYAGREDTRNCYPGMHIRSKVNQYYKMSYFSSFIEVTFQMKSQHSSFRGELLKPMEMVNMVLTNSPEIISMKYSGLYMVLSITHIFESTNMMMKVILGRTGDNNTAEAVVKTAVNNKTPS